MKDELVFILCKVNFKNEFDIFGDEVKISSVIYVWLNFFLIRYRGFFFIFGIFYLKIFKNSWLLYFFLVCMLLFWGFNFLFFGIDLCDNLLLLSVYFLKSMVN